FAPGAIPAPATTATTAIRPRRRRSSSIGLMIGTLFAVIAGVLGFMATKNLDEAPAVDRTSSLTQSTALPPVKPVDVPSPQPAAPVPVAAPAAAPDVQPSTHNTVASAATPPSNAPPAAPNTTNPKPHADTAHAARAHSLVATPAHRAAKTASPPPVP